MKSVLVLCISVLLPLYSYASDANVCNTLANVISLNQDRYDQAEVAFSDVNAICKDDAHPKACVEDIKKEYVDSRDALEKSQADYRNAGCK